MRIECVTCPQSSAALWVPLAFTSERGRGGGSRGVVEMEMVEMEIEMVGMEVETMGHWVGSVPSCYRS